MMIFGPVFGYMLDMLNEEGIEHIALADREEDPELEKAMLLLEEYQEFKNKNSKEEPESEEEEESEVVEEDEPEESEVPETGLMGRRET